ncbi:MAG: DUF5752 family protein [Gemmataceae bacterium]|nr:DUF5752 family protein [Gemmataceae bacterium]
MNATESFAVFDCSLVRYAIGRSCSNLRELLGAIRTVPDMVLEHHMMRCALDDHFELYEFPNDLARWCWAALGQRILAEELSLVDPYAHPSIAALRATLVNTIEERLWGVEQVTGCLAGLELHLLGSRLVAYDTGERLPTLVALAEALPRLSLRSFFYHVHEAHRRRSPPSDDFSAWLESVGAEAALVARLRKIDFYFLNLNQLRNELLEAIGQRMLPKPQAIVRATT